MGKRNKIVWVYLGRLLIIMLVQPTPCLIISVYPFLLNLIYETALSVLSLCEH